MASDDTNLHRNNAAEWAMWVLLLLVWGVAKLISFVRGRAQ